MTYVIIIDSVIMAMIMDSSDDNDNICNNDNSIGDKSDNGDYYCRQFVRVW